MSHRPVRVAVLGGGCAGVAAACELSRTPELRRQFQVTLYEASFRLGGKGATGRNRAHGQRIEEHGLHIWMGFYARAFRLMHDCYRELEHSPWSSPAEAFTAHYTASLAAAGAAGAWRLTLPPRAGQPWDPPGSERQMWWNTCSALVRAGVRQWPLRQQRPSVDGGASAPALPWLDQLRSLGVQTQLALALARGLAHDVFPHGPDGYLAIDNLDFCAWLERWGARRSEVHDAPPIRALYNLAFAYPDGVSGYGRGQMAAGAAVHALLQLLFRYRGAPFWRMRAGMGDTVFAPLYQLLVQRGVRVEFFHQVRQLRAARRAELAAVELDRHARPRGTYSPLESVRGIPCWPGQPRWAELEPAERGRNHEQCEQPLARCRLVAGEDFDAAILAIPAPCHRDIAAELLEHSGRYRRMLEEAHSVATAAAQLWLTEPLANLGWMDRSTIYTSGPRPFGSWAEMSEVLEHEDWPFGQRPRSVLYFCDACPDEFAALDDAGKAELLERAFHHWSRLLGRGSQAPRARAALLGALGDQYLRINHRPSDRYVLSLPGTTRHRLAPHETGIDRLYFAGDWTRTSINGGSVEAAVESGQTAAEHLLQRWG